MSDRDGFYERRIWFRGGSRGGSFKISAAEWLRCRGDTIGQHSGHTFWAAVGHGEDVVRTWVATGRASDCNTRRVVPRFCDEYIAHPTDEWGGTYCKLLAGHDPPCSAHYPTEPTPPVSLPLHPEQEK